MRVHPDRGHPTEGTIRVIHPAGEIYRRLARDDSYARLGDEGVLGSVVQVKLDVLQLPDVLGRFEGNTAQDDVTFLVGNAEEVIGLQLIAPIAKVTREIQPGTLPPVLRLELFERNRG